MAEPQSTVSEPTPSPILSDDQLPPVEPPSAGFILQLFVIPGVIVAGIVAVWFMFSWIAHSASARPEDIAQGLEGSGPARWQRASELADMLRNDRYPDFRKSSAAASRVAEILDREILAATSAGGMDDGSVNLRYFLCRSLGEFQVTDGLEVLLKAATTNRDPREQWVRRGAIQAIAVLAYQQMHGDLPNNSDSAGFDPANFDATAVEATLLELAGDEDDLIRSETAFALGRIATPACLQRLETMADDPHADTRYNAAVGLAQQGNSIALETLAEMLEFDSSISSVSIDGEVSPQTKLVKRAIIMKNAMGAIVTMAKSPTQADFTGVEKALQAIVDASPDELQKASVDPMVQAEAKRTWEYLQRSAG